MDLSLDIFLKKNRISSEDWDKAAIEFDDLKAIALDHADNVANLEDVASYLAKNLQKCSQVHSVRWRVKDPVHLIEKIVRKRAGGSEKYLKINSCNYTEIVTDLIGIRVLHLFKYEWINIQEHILKHWDPEEPTVAYVRSGDEGETIESYKTNSCEVKSHPAGYRSIHYVISTQPSLKKIFCEIQVRTIFEEGWSEIDHKIRYPNFSKNELISYFLTIFNRMAGSADEMGTFVKNLALEVDIRDREIDKFNSKQESHLSRIEELAFELSNEKNKSKDKDRMVRDLSSEIKKLRTNSQARTYNENNPFSTESLISQALNTVPSSRDYNFLIGNSADILRRAARDENNPFSTESLISQALNTVPSSRDYNFLIGNSAEILRQAARDENIFTDNSADRHNPTMMKEFVPTSKTTEKEISKSSNDQEADSNTEN